MSNLLQAMEVNMTMHYHHYMLATLVRIRRITSAYRVSSFFLLSATFFKPCCTIIIMPQNISVCICRSAYICIRVPACSTLCLKKTGPLFIIIIIDNRGLNARWCLTPLLLSLPIAA